MVGRGCPKDGFLVGYCKGFPGGRAVEDRLLGWTCLVVQERALHLCL